MPENSYLQTSDVDLQLDPDFRDKMDAEILRRVRSTVFANKDRDDILRGYCEQAEGVSQPYSDSQSSNQPCQLEDPMTDEHCTQLTAYLMASLRTEPSCLIEAVQPGDEDAASNMELALSVKCQQWEVPAKMHDVVFNAVRYPFAPAAITWKQDVKRVRKMKTVDAVTGEDVNPYLQDALNAPSVVDETEGTELTVQEAPATMEVPSEKYELVNQGPEVRAITPDNFYLYPAASQELDLAEQIVERVYFTKSELWSGIATFGWDEEEIENLIRMGGTDTPNRERIDGAADENDGIGSDYEDAMYECFLVTGQMPDLFDTEGRNETPEQYRDEDFLWLCCPDRDSVFSFGSCPYTVRPYTVYHISRKPNRLMGKCVPGYLETLQEESTANLRFKIDVLNLIANPVLKVREDYNDLDGDQMFAGKLLRYQQSPNEIVPLEQNFSAWEALTGQQQELRAYADKLMSAPGADQVEARDSGPLTATQSGMIGQSLSMKRDMFLQTFQEGNVRFYQLLVAIWLQHMGDDGEEIPNKGGEPVTVTQDDLDRRYRFIPHANSDATNPAQRLQTAMLKKQTVMEYISSVMSTPPQFWPYIYQCAKEILQDLGVRNIEGLIGKEPAGIDPMAILQEVITLAAPYVVQAAQMGDQNAAMVIQQVQALMQGLAPPQAQGVPQEGAQGQEQGAPQSMPYAQISAAQPAQMNGVH